GGTIFLDDIGEVSQNIQVKLLRVLQTKQFERVGGEQSINVDVRVIAATNKDLLEKIKEGTFREDLYFRLNVIHIHMPPLRERTEDIPLLVKFFIDKFSKDHQRQIDGITPKALKFLMAYSWPGNVRELMNVVENMVILTKENILDIQHIPQNIISEVSKRSDFILNDEPDEDIIKIKAGIPLEEVEKIYLLYLLDKYKNKAKVAQISGIGRKTLYNKLEKWGVPLDKSEA
ncbi:MAG TPA: sigma 54-interacting transcriptional regulator, partial [Exilispira sp.]|nr:sigma 54-interacting transcriptional regulator [Exilispira sp.]